MVFELQEEQPGNGLTGGLAGGASGSGSRRGRYYFIPQTNVFGLGACRNQKQQPKPKNSLEPSRQIAGGHDLRVAAFCFFTSNAALERRKSE